MPWRRGLLSVVACEMYCRLKYPDAQLTGAPGSVACVTDQSHVDTNSAPGSEYSLGTVATESTDISIVDVDYMCAKWAATCCPD